MVRVMSIYHFASQSIQQLVIEELSATCFIPPDEIVLARNSDHTIEIRPLTNASFDASQDEIAVKSFSSVDDVDKMVYSKVGNFIVTLESRISNYEKAEITYVRVYVNWDKSSSPTQSLRARIAGKITPMKKTLEMIELPLNFNPTSIASCPSTGNILVNHKNIIQVFIFKYCTNETTKLQYIDFFEAPFQIELDFIPSAVLINEDIISCSNKQFFHVFKVIETVDGNNSTASESNICTSTEIPQSEEATNINLDQDVDFQAICDKADLNGINFNVKMKSTLEETMGSLGDDDSEMRPSVITELSAIIKYINNLPETFALPSKFSIQNLLQLKLQSMKISGVLRENVDVFKCMYMKPLYVKPDTGSVKNFNSSNASFFMHSKFKKNFYGCAVLISTQQDGYLYQINPAHEQEPAKCYMNVYPFTSSVIDVYFNDNVLHALCENGIESYTHRIGQKLFTDFGARNYKDVDGVYRNLSTAISLVNLRPFMNVQFMIPGDDNLILLASDSTTPQAENPDEINWTIYNLKYPTMDTIYQDFKEFADKSLRKYPSVYMNLLEEIHLMIRSHMVLARLEPEDNSEVGNEMRLVWGECDELLKDSSLALADYLILSSSEYRQSLVFYEMAKLNIIGVFQRFLDQHPLFRHNPVGLIEVMKIGFQQLTSECDSRRFDEVFATTLSFPNETGELKPLKFGEALIELFKRFAPKEVAQLTLESTVFREYMDEKIYEFLAGQVEKSNDELLCIILHLLKKDEVSAANSLLSQIQHIDLYALLARNWNILFEFSTQSGGNGNKKISKSIISFSDITELLFLTIVSAERCELFTDVLLHHICDTKSVRFNGILKLFMEYLASQFGHESYNNGQNILKTLLEKYLLKYYETRTHDADISLLSSTSSGNTATLSVSSNDDRRIDRKCENLSWNDDDLNSGVSSHRHAMRMLVRIYLSQLKAMSMKQEKRAGQDNRINKAQLIKVIDEMSTSLFINQKPVTKFDKIAQLLTQHAGNNPILFLDERYRYLDWMPPFENLLQVLSDAHETDNQYEYNKIDKDLLMTLIKLQAMLCSGEVTSDVSKEVLGYLQSNREQLIGHDSILVCLLPLHQAIDLIIKNNPQCILEYARCHFKLDNDWSYLITSLQKKANEFEVNEANMGHILFYHRLLKETLEYLASSKPLDTVLKIFPEEKHLINGELFSMVDSKNSNDFDEYLKMCVDRERSDKIRKMIESTGVQLYEAINKN